MSPWGREFLEWVSIEPNGDILITNFGTASHFKEYYLDCMLLLSLKGPRPR